VAAGDSALVIEFEERIDEAVNERAIALAAAIQQAAVRGVRDIVPTYRAVAIYFDPLRTAYDQLTARIHDELTHPSAEATTSRAPVRIPVCYGGDLGPDLGDVAAFAGVSEAEVIRRHAAAIYRVFMLGFVAGFAYMGTVDASIAAPRRATPRVRVPLGSVGIAGVQTGVYPAETPGGWQIIGRTPVKPFDAARAEPFLMQAGDHVLFYAITTEEFVNWRSA
jgi:KipI family sensor histidine kinase inhibitor